MGKWSVTGMLRRRETTTNAEDDRCVHLGQQMGNDTGTIARSTIQAFTTNPI